MKRAALLISVATGLLMGCATLTSPLRSKQEDRFKAGMQALSHGDYVAARSELAWVAEHYANGTLGQRALLILAAIEMDPRNPLRRSDVGADLVGSFLRLPERDSWVDPVAQTLYLQGLEMGAAEERAERAERDAERALPKLPGPTVSARIKAIEQDRDRLAKRVTALEAQLADKERELERIRKTIKP